MNHSLRLDSIASLVVTGETAADIGADHAQLAITLVQDGIVPRVIIGELQRGPYDRACRAVAASHLEEQIELRLGDGLQVLGSGEVATIVIAGLGGDTITDILAFDSVKTASFYRLVLQPMSKPEVLRKHLAGTGWLFTEKLVEENSRIYSIMVCHLGHQPYTIDGLAAEIGPSIMEADTVLKVSLLKRYLARYRRVHRELTASLTDSKIILADLYKERISQLEAILGASKD